MSELRIDYSLSDQARRMKILEMAAGDLVRAKELETWVMAGDLPELVVSSIEIPEPPV